MKGKKYASIFRYEHLLCRVFRKLCKYLGKKELRLGGKVRTKTYCSAQLHVISLCTCWNCNEKTCCRKLESTIRTKNSIFCIIFMQKIVNINIRKVFCFINHGQMRKINIRKMNRNRIRYSISVAGNWISNCSKKKHFSIILFPISILLNWIWYL